MDQNFLFFLLTKKTIYRKCIRFKGDWKLKMKKSKLYLDEIRKIRERKSLETKDMSTEEASAYFMRGADEARKIMKEMKQELEIQTNQPIKKSRFMTF